MPLFDEVLAGLPEDPAGYSAYFASHGLRHNAVRKLAPALGRPLQEAPCPPRKPAAVSREARPPARPPRRTDCTRAAVPLGGVDELDELETELRDDLVGVKVLAEIGLSQALQERVEAAVELADSVDRKSLDWLRREYPAVLATYFVVEGIQRYKAGTYWENLPVKLGTKSDMGHAFLVCLSALGLETFADLDEPSLKYVTPILAHGGVPRYSLGDFFGLLVRTLNQNPGADATEFLTIVRSKRSAFAGIDAPVKRFLLHGGAAATDFLERCIDLRSEHVMLGRIPAAHEVGLPPHVVEAYAEHIDKSESGAGHTPTSRLTVRRPKVVLDPYSGVGPQLELPVVPADLGLGTWQFETQAVQAAYAGGEALQLEPRKRWSVGFHHDDLERTFEIPAMAEGNVMLFDPDSWALVRGSGPVRLSTALVVMPADVSAVSVQAGAGERPAEDVEELPALFGSWQGWVVRHIDLTDATSLTIDDTRIAVAAPPDRPRLADDPVPLPGVTTANGLPVYAEVPDVVLPSGDTSSARWRVRVFGIGGSHDHSATTGELGCSGGECSVARLFPSEPCGEFELHVRGPLGGASDLRERFAVVHGLQVGRPLHVLRPHDDVPAMAVGAPAMIVTDEAGAPIEALQAEPGEPAARCRVRGTSGEVGLRVDVPRLMFRFAGRSAPTRRFSHDPVTVTYDLGSTPGLDSLLVRTGLEGRSVRVDLEISQSQAQTLTERTTRGDVGTAVFDLRALADTVRAADGAPARLVAWVDGLPAVIAHISTDYSAEILPATTSRVIDDFTEIAVHFTDGSGTVQDRELRLWSKTRPWQEAMVFPIPDKAVDVALVRTYDPIPPGDYIAQIGLHDPWVKPTRPSAHKNGAMTLRVGTREQAQSRLDTLDLIYDPLAVIEYMLAGSVLPRRLESSELEAVMPQLLTAFVSHLDSGGRSSLSDRVFGQLRKLITVDPASLVAALVDAAAQDQLDADDALKVTICTLGRALHKIESGEASPALTASTAAALWVLSPPLASAMDTVLALRYDDDAYDRCATWVCEGWMPDSGSPNIGVPLKQAEIGFTREALRGVRERAQVRPTRVLDEDAYFVSQLEWLENRWDAPEAVSGWCADARRLALFQSSDPGIKHALEERQLQGRHLADWVDLPWLTLGAALHVVAGTDGSVLAQGLLLEATSFAPKRVTYDLTLAAVLIATANGDHYET
ncbi:MAG: hypothetical protein K1X95_04335 [Acidimicrobiia bacterium]|nr:hypothetical protein [Acidimicrobiia bacterium]